MAVDRGFAAHLDELFGGLGAVRVKAMFGGAGLYVGELMIGLIADDTLYLRADAQTEDRFRAAGSEPFNYAARDGKVLTMSYWRAPDEVLESAEEAAPWAWLALEAARRKQASKAKSAKR